MSSKEFSGTFPPPKDPVVDNLFRPGRIREEWAKEAADEEAESAAAAAAMGEKQKKLAESAGKKSIQPPLGELPGIKV